MVWGVARFAAVFSLQGAFFGVFLAGFVQFLRGEIVISHHVGDIIHIVLSAPLAAQLADHQLFGFTVDCLGDGPPSGLVSTDTQNL